MTKPLRKYRNALVILILVLLTQACAQVRLDAPSALPTAQDIESPVAEEEQSNLLPTPTATIEIPAPTQTGLSATAVPIPDVTISAVKGNLFIRRGPDMAFNPTGVLYKDASAKVIARDVLSDWVQIEIPGSNRTGWVSIQTSYSKIEGDLKDLPDFTPTEWPKAAYLRNCTYHRMYVLPSEVVIPPSFEFPDNEIWIYPGDYVIYDIDIPGDPDVMKITVKEGSDIEIQEDGLGGHRKCP